MLGYQEARQFDAQTRSLKNLSPDEAARSLGFKNYIDYSLTMNESSFFNGHLIFFRKSGGGKNEPI